LSIAIDRTGDFVPTETRNQLRVSQAYGLGLKTFLSRLDAGPHPAIRAPHWFTLNGTALNFDNLAAALRTSPAELTAMAPDACYARLPQELGLCLQCFEDALATGQPVTWFRRWMHPLYGVCGIHAAWLTPIAYRTLVRIRHAAEFGTVTSRLGTLAGSHQPQTTSPDDALWLQRLCCTWTAAQLPWGSVEPHELHNIIDVLAAMLSLASARGDDMPAAPDDLDQSSFKGFTLRSAAGHWLPLNLAVRLPHRQWILGIVAHVLRRAPGERSWGRTWPTSIAQRLARETRTHWPAGALEWICPQAAEAERQFIRSK